jgi:hypothetical protein
MAPQWVLWDAKDVGLTPKARFFVPNQQVVVVRVVPFNAERKDGNPSEWMVPTGDEPQP